LIRHFTDRSLFGYKILGSWYSILVAYIFIGLQLIITPLFGISSAQLIAGALFILIINVSTLILILNALFRKRNLNLLWILAMLPLLSYMAFSIQKIITKISYLMDLII
tara:strand:+ start:2590 stop:2916 length:327 start_codon:yes stop_codon:yes gene_type:complete